MANNRLSRSARIRRLKKTREAFNNTRELTSRQRDARRRIEVYLRSKEAQAVAPVNERDQSRELDEVEDVTRESLRARPIEGIGSDWEDDGQQDETNDSQQMQEGQDTTSNDSRLDQDNFRDKKQEGRTDELKKTRPGEKPKTEKPISSNVKPGVTPSSGGPSIKVGDAMRVASAAKEEGLGAAAKQAATAAVKQQVEKQVGARLLAFFATPPGWVTLLIILALGLIVSSVMLFTQLGKNKTFSSIGGSVPVNASFDKEDQRAVVERVQALVTPPEGEPTIIVRAPAMADDLIGWEEANGKKKSKADYRVLQMLGYLADKGWSKIVIGLTKSNGPDVTRRQGLNVQGKPEQIEAMSAYATGQAIGIMALGETSPGLTACLQLSAPIPVEIAWQETAIETELRHIHEKLQVNASTTYLLMLDNRAFTRREGAQLLGQEGDTRGYETQSLLREMMTALQNNRSTNPVALRYANEALVDIEVAMTDGTQASYEQMKRGLAKTFRALQVANMQGWEGSRSEGCRLWKAFEARQNQRKLALHLMQMPVVVMDDKTTFNWDVAVKQMIVFSPEDDLDNGLHDTDIFPSGALAVDVGGVSYDNIGKDGQITEDDNNFLALPQDNWILSKKSTVFGKEDEEGNVVEDAEGMGETAGPRQEADEIWDFGYKSGARVSYKNFVHIGF